jgi:hypothetical protein
MAREGGKSARGGTRADFWGSEFPVGDQNPLSEIPHVRKSVFEFFQFVIEPALALLMTDHMRFQKGRGINFSAASFAFGGSKIILIKRNGSGIR